MIKIDYSFPDSEKSKYDTPYLCEIQVSAVETQESAMPTEVPRLCMCLMGCLDYICAITPLDGTPFAWKSRSHFICMCHGVLTLVAQYYCTVHLR